jgi:hypothetical protein
MFKAYTPFHLEELEMIQRWGFANFIRNRGDAVRALVRKGLESENAGRVRVVADQTAATIDRVTHHFSTTIGGALKWLIKRDPQFLARGDDTTRTLTAVVAIAIRGLPYVLKGQEIPTSLQVELHRISRSDPLRELEALLKRSDPFGEP